MSLSGQIPVDNTKAYFTVRLPLGDATYVLTFRYNTRMDRWLLDVADANQNPILQGQVIQGGWPVTSRFYLRYSGLPGGLIFSVDRTGQNRDPQELTFGADCPLFYLEL